MTFTCSLILAAAVATTSAPVTTPAPPLATTSLRTTVALAAVETAPQIMPRDNGVPEAWMLDRPERRPSVLPMMYATLGALQVFDVYSTRQALAAGANEANPLMHGPATNSGAMLAVKAVSTVGTIYFIERAWKQNRKGAVITMAIINGTMAAIAANNMRNARR